MGTSLRAATWATVTCLTPLIWSSTTWPGSTTAARAGRRCRRHNFPHSRRESGSQEVDNGRRSAVPVAERDVERCRDGSETSLKRVRVDRERTRHRFTQAIIQPVDGDACLEGQSRPIDSWCRESNENERNRAHDHVCSVGSWWAKPESSQQPQWSRRWWQRQAGAAQSRQSTAAQERLGPDSERMVS